MDDSITVLQHAVSPPAAHSTGTLPSPSEDVVLLFAPEEINMFKNNKQTKKYLLQKYFLMIREALDCSEQPGDEASVVHRSDDEVYILLEMASTWRSVLRIQTTATRLKRGQAAVLSFDWVAEAEQQSKKGE